MTLSLFIPYHQEFFSDSGRAISFKPDDDSTFLVGTTSLCYTLLFLDIRMTQYSCANNQVGTDEGMVYLCTTQYSSKYLNTYPVSRTKPCTYPNILLQHLFCKKNQVTNQGCISCGILVSGIRACGVSWEHMENMEIFSCSPT